MPNELENMNQAQRYLMQLLNAYLREVMQMFPYGILQMKQVLY